ncbi:nitroreductase family protein [Guggenheimella bovis]
MNQTIETQLNHRSIRKWEGKVDKETIKLLEKVVNRTATSNGMQNFSVIRVVDPMVREKISEVCKQKYVTEAPEFWVFIVDCYRNAKITEEAGEDLPAKADMDRFFQGYSDAVLAAQNLTNAIESLNYGAVFFGSILNDSERMIELLHLPRLTFPVLGVGFGMVAEEPEKKPRMKTKYKVFTDQYEKLENYHEALKNYDEKMKEYYDLRDTSKPLDSFTAQVVDKLKHPIEKRSKIVQVIEKQGFKLGLEK